MKTTLDLPDDLLIEAKAVAARRRTTLKEMVARSLRREIGLDDLTDSFPVEVYETSELGLPRLKKRGAPVTSKMVRQMLDDAEQEDEHKVLAPRKA